MADHEQPDHKTDYSEQTNAVYSMPKQPHSGMDHLPDDLRESPAIGHDDDTPLAQVVGSDFDSGSIPGDSSSITVPPNEAAVMKQSVEERRRARLESSRSTSELSKKRKIIIGAAAGATTLGLVAAAYLGLARGGEDAHNKETGATSGPKTPGKSDGGNTKSAEKPLITTALDSSVSPNVTPLTDNQFEQLNLKNWPNTVEKALEANMQPDTLKTLTRGGNYQRLLDAYPDWDDLYSLYQKYGSDSGAQSIVNTIGNRNFMNRVYNDDYAATSEAYGQSQNFRNPETAKLIGKAPFVKLSEFDKAAQNGNFQSVWNKLYPPNRDYEKALLGELEAGNTGPAVVDQFVKLAMLGNELQGNVDSTQTRDGYEQSTRDRLTTLYNEYLKDPKAAQKDYEDGHAATLTPKIIAMMDGIRQLPGQHIIAGDDANVTLTTGTVYQRYSVTGADGADQEYTYISVVAFVAAPTSTPNNQYVMPILIDQISRQTG